MTAVGDGRINRGPENRQPRGHSRVRKWLEPDDQNLSTYLLQPLYLIVVLTVCIVEPSVETNNPLRCGVRPPLFHSQLQSTLQHSSKAFIKVLLSIPCNFTNDSRMAIVLSATSESRVIEHAPQTDWSKCPQRAQNVRMRSDAARPIPSKPKIAPIRTCNLIYITKVPTLCDQRRIIGHTAVSQAV